MLSIARPRRYVVECVAVLGITLAWTWAIYTGYGGPAVSQAVSNVGLAAVALAAALTCAATAFRRTGRYRRIWLLLGGSALSWGLGQLIWTWYESVLHQEPFPSLADVGYLGAVPLSIAALMMLPSTSETLAGRVRALLDGLLIACSLLITSWVLVLGPIVEAGGETLLAQAISVAYPVADVVMVTIVVYVALRARRARRGSRGFPIVPVGLALISVSVADSGFLYLQLTETYVSGSLIDAGWFVGYGLLLVAARTPMAEGPAGPTRPEDAPQLGLLLPYAAVALAFGTHAVELLRTGSTEPFVSWTRSLIFVLLVTRQVLTLRENRSLTRDLESRVVERTAELRASERRFQALVQHSSEVVTVVELDSTVVYQSESRRHLFGGAGADIVGRRLTELLTDESAVRLGNGLRDAANEPYGMRVLELTVAPPGGDACQVEMTITNLLENPSVRGLVLNTRDVTERRRLEQQLVHEAFHDALTGLANRSLFIDRVDRALRQRERRRRVVAVLFLDLDGFKEVNDSLGHAAGDLLLTSVAGRLLACARPSDTVARLGGDEFAVLVEDPIGELHAEDVAERITRALDDPFVLSGQEIQVRASIGIATAGPQEDADHVLRNADLAMYRAKAAGEGGTESYHPRMHTELIERLELEADLRRALDGEELELLYQPTVSLSSGRIVGVEALLRWNHPARGVIMPTEFVGAAENIGMIRPIGRWALERACAQAAAWRHAYATPDGFTISVNVSVCQLQSGVLVDDVAGALESSGLPAEHLVLELTESVLMDHSKETLRALERVRELGVRLAIDDFGTGYSSLSYLQRFPFDTLKIDRSFVDRLLGPSPEVDLVRTIVSLGQSLRMTTVAEGIEDHTQFLALRRMGCDLGQGYHFSLPGTGDELGALLEESAAAVALGAPPAPSAWRAAAAAIN